jgi:hypothetical protein
MRARHLILPALLVAAGIPTTAQADRAPTDRERAGIARAVGVPKRCLRIRVSTVDRRWSGVRIRLAKRSCQRWAADGIAIFKRRGDRWRFVTAGSSFDCPVPKVPRRVARDLQIPCEPGR